MIGRDVHVFPVDREIEVQMPGLSLGIRFGALALHFHMPIDLQRTSFFASTATYCTITCTHLLWTNQHTCQTWTQIHRQPNMLPNPNTQKCLAYQKVHPLRRNQCPSKITPHLTHNPPDASITKRPLMRPAIVSPYASSSAQKIVYVSARTPFMSAIKRVEKLLRLADKRDLQTATTHAQKNKRKRRRDDDGGEDEVLAVARGVEEEKERKRRAGGVGGEEVLVKGTGKAVSKVMEIGGWFLQREKEFVVRVRTGSVGAVDDVEVPEGEGEAGGGEDKMDVDQAQAGAEGEKVATNGDDSGEEKEAEAVSGARVRYLSVLEVAVSLR